jgi:hypothetical protein
MHGRFTVSTVFLSFLRTTHLSFICRGARHSMLISRKIFRRVRLPCAPDFSWRRPNLRSRTPHMPLPWSSLSNKHFNNSYVESGFFSRFVLFQLLFPERTSVYPTELFLGKKKAGSSWRGCWWKSRIRNISTRDAIKEIMKLAIFFYDTGVARRFSNLDFILNMPTTRNTTISYKTRRR